MSNHSRQYPARSRHIGPALSRFAGDPAGRQSRREAAASGPPNQASSETGWAIRSSFRGSLRHFVFSYFRSKSSQQSFRSFVRKIVGTEQASSPPFPRPPRSVLCLSGSIGTLTQEWPPLTAITGICTAAVWVSPHCHKKMTTTAKSITLSRKGTVPDAAARMVRR